jgi:hypothetical protein
MNVPSKSNGGVGPIRAKSTSRASPYVCRVSSILKNNLYTQSGLSQNREHGRESRAPKGDVNAAWSHDLFEGHRSLSERLSSSSSSLAPKPNFGIAQKALKDAIGSEASSNGGLNIKGASSVREGNVVQVSGLVKGTTPADVEVSSCSRLPFGRTRLTKPMP